MEEFEYKKPKPSGDREKKLIIILLAVITVLLIAILIIVIKKRSDTANNLVSPTATAGYSPTYYSPTVSPTASKTKTATATPGATATEDTDSALNGAKAVATNFMNAYIFRSLEKAMPYMTDAFIAGSNQEGFAGTSSPSRDRFDILSASVKDKAAQVYQVKTRVYYTLNGQDSGSEDFNLDVVKSATKYLVSNMSAV